MLKKFRVYVSILLITFLLLSPVLFSRQFSAKACPPPPPETLLSLFLRSDVIFVADITSEKDGETTVDEETYQYIDIVRNLNISKVLKGKTGRDFSFTQGEYRAKTSPEEVSTEDETEEYSYNPYGYSDYSELTVGQRYLFFFIKSEETGVYVLADDTTGYRNLNDHDLGIFEDRIAELKNIIALKENQLELLTSWYLKCIEEPSTRWDGVMSLRSSFNALQYQDEEDKAEREKFVFNEEFSEYSPEIAESLSDSQKEFLSGILFSSLQQKMFESNTYNYYNNLENIVKIWDKQRLVMFVFDIFQTADKSDVEKNKSTMRYIAWLVDDRELWDIFSRYEEAEDNSEVTETESDAATVSEETKIEPEIAVQTEEVRPTPDQIREQVLQDFTNRYYQLLARNFVEEVTEEIAQQ